MPVKRKNNLCNLRFLTNCVTVCLPGISFVMLTLGLAWLAFPTAHAASGCDYPWHRQITATVFWVGEKASGENGYIANKKSCWDERWQQHYGGVDAPNHRHGYRPAAFTPKENPFYCALPYSDFDDNGRKANAVRVIPWAATRKWRDQDSMCKNRWVAITRHGKSAFAQWEDAGPFASDDTRYVFGHALPRSKHNHHAGLDVSPAVSDYLGLTGDDKVDWHFVEDSDVPPGPWQQIITHSQTYWDE